MREIDPKGLAMGCCSSISPCPHQQRDPNSLCETCAIVAKVRAKKDALAAPAEPAGVREARVSARRDPVLFVYNYLTERDGEVGCSSEDDERLASARDIVAALSRPDTPDAGERQSAPGGQDAGLSDDERAAVNFYAANPRAALLDLRNRLNSRPLPTPPADRSRT